MAASSTSLAKFSRALALRIYSWKPFATATSRKFAPVSASVAAAGYDGYVEVEIFNADVWAASPDQTAAKVRERFAAVLGGG